MKRPRSPRYTERFNYVDDDADRASSPPSSSSSPPVNKQDGFLYDVFLSFRGPDTRNGFTSHLYHELKDNKGIRTFMDSEELEKGQEVDKLFGYIERSKILLPIFSKGYADSKWCLREIAKIVECKRLVIPVFFDVEPRDVGHQTGPFTEAFRDYVEKDDVNKEEVSKWRDAMTTLGKVSGYTLADTRGNEAKLIQLIVKRVLMEVNKTSIYVADYPVGLDARITDVMEKLDIEAAGDAKMVGIYGMGGLGKTTLAKAVYNKISNRFDASCFIPNIRDAAKRYDDLLSRQKQLIRDLFSNEKEVNSIDEGIGIINIWMQRKKVLLVLDDVDDKLVDNKSQIQAMVGDRLFCSGSGSRIIVTTRNKQVFNTQEGVNVYELEGLNDVQSLELFSWHAFRQRQPTEEFAQLSRDAASTAARLPLALKIFGSHFYDLKTVKEWEDALKILKDDQHKDIYQRLKISFDALLEREKQVFLDIACFFIGDSWKISVEHATLMWEDCKFYPNTTIKVLMHKSLVSINDETGEFEMHDHIRDMGRKIVQDEGLYKGSRLWEVEKTLDVLQNKQEMENVEAIQLYPEFHEEITLEAMPRLRMLELGWNVTLEGHCKHFLKKLKWLEWEIEGLDSLPDGLQFGNLVVLDLSKSSITQVWNPQTYGRKKK